MAISQQMKIEFLFSRPVVFPRSLVEDILNRVRCVWFEAWGKRREEEWTFFNTWPLYRKFVLLISRSIGKADSFP